MDIKLLKKDILILFRNKTASITVIIVLLLQITTIIYARNIYILQAENSVGSQFNFIQNHILIFYFPIIVVNIISIAFSMSKEKQNFMLAKLIPFGESSFLRSKAIISSMISSFLGFVYLFASIYFCDLEIFQNTDFMVSMSFFLLFTIISLSYFSVFYAVLFFDGNNNYEPDLKGIMGYMLIVSIFVISSFLILVKNLRLYYDYAMGFKKVYPNYEFVVMMLIGFLFIIITRILLNLAEKKLIRE